MSLFCFELAAEKLLLLSPPSQTKCLLKFSFLNFATVELCEVNLSQNVQEILLAAGKTCFFATEQDTLLKELKSGFLTIFLSSCATQESFAGAKLPFDKVSNDISLNKTGIVRLSSLSGAPVADLNIAYRLSPVKSTVTDGNFPQEQKLLTERGTQASPVKKSTFSAGSQAQVRQKERRLQTVGTKTKTRQTQTFVPEEKFDKSERIDTPVQQTLNSTDFMALFGRFLSDFLPKNHRSDYPVLRALCHELDSATLVNDVQDIAHQRPSRHSKCLDRIYGSSLHPSFNVHAKIQSAKTFQLYSHTKTSAQRLAYGQMIAQQQTAVGAPPRRRSRAQSAPAERITFKDASMETEQEEKTQFSSNFAQTDAQPQPKFVSSQTQTETETKAPRRRSSLKPAEPIPPVPRKQSSPVKEPKSQSSYSADFVSEAHSVKQGTTSEDEDTSEADSIHTQIRADSPRRRSSVASSVFSFEASQTRRKSTVVRLPSIRRESSVSIVAPSRKQSLRRQSKLQSPPLSPVTRYLETLREKEKKRMSTPSSVRTESVSSYMPSDLEGSPS